MPPKEDMLVNLGNVGRYLQRGMLLRKQRCYYSKMSRMSRKQSATIGVSHCRASGSLSPEELDLFAGVCKRLRVFGLEHNVNQRCAQSTTAKLGLSAVHPTSQCTCRRSNLPSKCCTSDQRCQLAPLSSTKHMISIVAFKLQYRRGRGAFR